MSISDKLLKSAAAGGLTPSENFNTLLYDGNNSSQSITGLGFQPDLLWIKQRHGTNPHGLWDSTRGAGKLLVVNTTAAETGNAGDFVGSFDEDGFEVNRNYLTYTTHDTTNYGIGDAKKYVAWAWKGLVESHSHWPMPEEILLAFTVLCLHWDWPDVAAYLILGFLGMLRPFECIAIRPQDLSFWVFLDSSCLSLWGSQRCAGLAPGESTSELTTLFFSFFLI